MYVCTFVRACVWVCLLACIYQVAWKNLRPWWVGTYAARCAGGRGAFVQMCACVRVRSGVTFDCVMGVAICCRHWACVCMRMHVFVWLCACVCELIQTQGTTPRGRTRTKYNETLFPCVCVIVPVSMSVPVSVSRIMSVQIDFDKLSKGRELDIPKKFFHVCTYLCLCLCLCFCLCLCLCLCADWLRQAVDSRRNGYW